MVYRTHAHECGAGSADSGARDERSEPRTRRSGFCEPAARRSTARHVEAEETAMRREGGFSLVELLLASVITLVVVGGAFELVAPAQRMFQAQPEAADMQQRLRVAVDALRRD